MGVGRGGVDVLAIGRIERDVPDDVARLETDPSLSHEIR